MISTAMIQISEAALIRLNQLQQKKLFLKIHAGGCAGQSYTFSFSEGSVEMGEGKFFLCKGVEIIVSGTLNAPETAIIDYQFSLLRRKFVLKKAGTRFCRCGNSFR